MTAGLRERKKELTRATLARAALRLFDERGFQNVTVDEIAEACDVSPRTFFRYFVTKEDALFAEGESRRSRLLEALDAQPAAHSPFEKLQGASQAVASQYLEDRDLLLARARIVESTPALQMRDAELPQRWDREVFQHLHPGPAGDPVPELALRLTVGASMTALRVSIEAWILANATTDLASTIESTFAQLRTGLQ